MHKAATGGHLDVLELLINEGCAIDTADDTVSDINPGALMESKNRTALAATISETMLELNYCIKQTLGVVWSCHIMQKMRKGDGLFSDEGSN